MIAKGKTMREVAEALGTSKSNISIHLKKAMRKLRRYEEVEKAVQEEFEKRIKKIEENVDILMRAVLLLIIERS